MRRRWVLPALLAVTVAVVSAVALGRQGASEPVREATAGFDPPAVFDTAEQVALPRELDADPLPVVLDGFLAFVALPDRLHVIDTRSGAVISRITPGAKVESGVDPRAPVRADVGGRPRVVTAFGVRMPGRGTTLGHDAVELLAVDIGTHRTSAVARIDLPPSTTDEHRLRAAWPVAAAGDVVVVAIEVGAARDPVSYAVDMGTGVVRWKADGLAAAALSGDVVVGASGTTGTSTPAAVRLTDGRPLWSAGRAQADVSVWPAGPDTVAAASVSSGTGARTLAIHATATGRVLMQRSVPGSVTCRFDERRTTVCWLDRSGQAWAAGFDASSGRMLWELPDPAAGRVAPEVSAVWHGTVYGTTGNGTVALDARTGADLPRSPGIAPDLVNAYVGIVGSTIEHPRVRAYRAAG